MPAIQPAVLRQQAALLAEHFDQPIAFSRSLRHLLEVYADRTHRSGRLGIPPPLSPAYHVRPPVLRQVLLELKPLISEFPEKALLLCDALWLDEYYEFRILAIRILGQTTPVPQERVLQRVREWIGGQPEKRLVEAIIQEGCSRLQAEQPDAYLEQVESWIMHPQAYYQQIGLQAILPVIKNGKFVNLPVIFQLLQPLVVTIQPAVKQDIIDLLKALAETSPFETAFFLRQNLDNYENPGYPFLMRQVLGSFPSDLQESLRQEVRKYS
jgi:hypothetical protein